MFTQKLVEKLRKRGVQCHVRESDVCKGYIVLCDYVLDWKEYLQAMKEATSELGGKLEDNSPDEDQAWYIAWFVNTALDIYPFLVNHHRLEIEICSGY